MVVAKTRKGKAHENRTNEGPRTRVKTSGRRNALLASPIYIGQAQGKEETYKKRSQRARVLSLSLSLFLFLFSLRLLGQHALTSRGCIFLYFLNKTEL